MYIHTNTIQPKLVDFYTVADTEWWCTWFIVINGQISCLNEAIPCGADLWQLMVEWAWFCVRKALELIF